MFSAYFLEHAALAIALAGLAGVAIEIAVKDRSLFGKILGDGRALATPAPLRTFGKIDDATAAAAANGNTRRAAAA